MASWIPVTQQQPTSRLVAFLAGYGPDGTGRVVEQVLSFSDEQIERHHDFIQWLFPLPTRSAVVPDAPVLSSADMQTIRANTELQRTISRALERMSILYARNDHWLAPHDHNHLRITRIIRSARLLLGHEPAAAFHARIAARVEEAGNPVSDVSLAFWHEALRDSADPPT